MICDYKAPPLILDWLYTTIMDQMPGSHQDILDNRGVAHLRVLTYTYVNLRSSERWGYGTPRVCLALPTTDIVIRV